MESELPVIGGVQADPRQLIDTAPGISERVGSGNFKAFPSSGCPWLWARVWPGSPPKELSQA